MLRFYDMNYTDTEIIRVNQNQLTFGDGIWNEYRKIVRACVRYHDCLITLFPIKDKEGKLAAYGYQDNEADRELRMLRELIQCRDALQFPDIFPDYKEVIICGCNELAVSFAEYLKLLGVKVSVTGKYWGYLGYDSCKETDVDGVGKLVIFAEGMMLPNGDLAQAVRKSASPEFECIDKIYEANVLKGKIHDTIGSFEDLVCRLAGEQEVVILGDGRESQDAYDLLLGHGIDICGFAVEGKTRNRLLGKAVMDIDEAISCLNAPVFVECHGKNGALGGEFTEYFDYRGYERNSHFFLIRDYTEIPVSNLVHVLCGKNVVLAGDMRLNRLLSEYLYKSVNGNISIKCIGFRQSALVEKDDIVCIVIPDYYNRLDAAREKRILGYRRFLTDIVSGDYTEYFIRSRSFALVDEYLNRGSEKYTTAGLTPKGILMGKIPPWSGNVFFRGIMDGHPEILIIPYSELNENLFWYCLRLAGEASDKLLKIFWEMYDEEACNREQYFPAQERFEASIQRFLRLKKSFTSQELFVMFHIAYAEMLSGTQISDVCGLVIYWEPHFVPRYDFPFLACWLEDKKVNAQTIVLRRNNMVRTGSACARTVEHHETALSPFFNMFLDESGWNAGELGRHLEFKMRFEDIKLNAREVLESVCERIDITWSEKMLKTTSYGEPLSYRGSVDFALKPVFNQYTDFLSEFDRFRISIASSPYQKRYGYVYEDCLKFSRREIQEMFLKPFQFESNALFKTDDKTRMSVWEWMKWQLWGVRKHMVLDDIQPEFGQIVIK